MKKSSVLFRKSILSLALLGVTSSGFAETTEDKLTQLQQQVLQLQTMLQQQKEEVGQSLQKEVSKPAVLPDLTHLVTKNGTEVELYGNLRADASYQMKGGSLMYNTLNSVPLKDSVVEDANAHKFQSTLNVTRFGINLTGPQAWSHKVGGKLEMDFFGGAARDTFRIRHAYITLDNWLIGQTWSNFNAIEYFPETVDASLSAGGSLTRTAQVKYTYQFDSRLNFAVSLEDPKTETGDPDSKLEIPSATGRFNYKFSNDSVVSGRLFLTQKSTNHDQRDDFIAWGVALGGKYQITPTTLIRADYNHIKGDSKNVLFANSGYKFDENGKMQANELNALTLGVTQKITPKIRSTIGLGYMRAGSNNEFAQLAQNDTTQNKVLKQVWINAFYTPVPAVNVGIEYMYGERETFNDNKGIDNRINATVAYSF